MKRAARLADRIALCLACLFLLLVAVDVFVFDLPFIHTGRPGWVLGFLALLLGVVGRLLHLRRKDDATKGDLP